LHQSVSDGHNGNFSAGGADVIKWHWWSPASKMSNLKLWK